MKRDRADSQIPHSIDFIANVLATLIGTVHTQSSFAGMLCLLLLSIVVLLAAAGCGRQSPAVQNQAAAPAPAPPKTELRPSPGMVLIKAGSFVRSRHWVTLSHDFWLAKYEVTQGEYTALLGRNPSHFKDVGTNCPVEKVSYVDAMRYCAALSQREREARRLAPGYEYRLPSEAEWEYACRAGTTNLFSFRDSTTEADHYAWTAENSDGKPHPVGQKLPNPWGLYDMHGNVWEWTLDWYAPYPATDLRDPAGPSHGRFKVFRGGGWNNDIEYARSANRFGMSPTNGIYFVGFRVALGQNRP